MKAGNHLYYFLFSNEKQANKIIQSEHARLLLPFLLSLRGLNSVLFLLLLLSLPFLPLLLRQPHFLRLFLL
ncbi:hypothetical protein BT69DRAFT_1118105 [Atractiella rhizophila]|nr:hypothetical protein BT69DRAFT_1118105 [Atractiella rhizophila]